MSWATQDFQLWTALQTSVSIWSPKNFCCQNPCLIIVNALRITVLPNQHWFSPQFSVHENHRTCQTFPMARPKCLMGNFANLNRIYQAHQTNVWWTIEFFRLHWQFNIDKQALTWTTCRSFPIHPPRTPHNIAHWQVAPPARPPSRWISGEPLIWF